MSDAWNPDRYGAFADERSRPFFDLIDLIDPPPAGVRVADLGCGTGSLTRTLVDRWHPSDIVGVDNSPAMLAEARANAGGALRFVEGDLRAPPVERGLDVLVSNAALHWVPDHRAVLSSWRDLLGGGGQLAVQVPSNADHPAHAVAEEVAHEPRFLDAMDGAPPPDPLRNVLTPQSYATMLDELGFEDQSVRLQVYGFHVASTAEVVEWMRGANLTRFESCLEPDDYDAFLARFRTRLVEVVGDRRPYFYPFKRVLLWARRPASSTTSGG